MTPESIAVFSPNTGPPTSRTVVKPRISVSVASTPAAFDDLCLGAAVRWNGCRGDAFNLVTANEHVAGTGERTRLSIEDPHVLEEYDGRLQGVETRFSGGFSPAS
jgi:hypothetical protein